MLFRILLVLQLLTILRLTKGRGIATTSPFPFSPPPTPPPLIPKYCFEAFEDCAFEFKGFEGQVPRFRIGLEADKTFSTRIISKDPQEKLGVLNSNGITPEVIVTSGFPSPPEGIPITSFGTPPYTETHVKPYPLPKGGSGIGHQEFTGNQLELARGRCIRIFFTSYQVLVGPPEGVRNVNAEMSDFKCVVFFTEFS